MAAPLDLSKVSLPPILNRHAFEVGLSSYHDRTFVTHILNCIDNGVNIGFTGLRTFRCSPNWSSCNVFHSDVYNSIQSDVALGRKLGPFPCPPTSTFMGSPMGAFAKRRNPEKVRVIHDLSWPPGQSVNDFIDKDKFSVQYMSIDNVVSHIQHVGQSALLAKLDLSDAFHHIRVRPQDWELLGSTWPNADGSIDYYVSTVLPFGLRSSPKLFTDFALASKLIMQARGVSYVDQYLDDFITVGAPNSYECHNNLSNMLSVCHDLGFAVNPSKLVDATTKLEFLGILLDTDSQELRITEDRLAEIYNDLIAWRGKKRGKKRALLSLIGKLSFVSRVVRSGRSFLRRLIETASKAKHLHHYVKLTCCFHSDLEWWLAFLREWNGVSMFPDDRWLSSNDMHLYTDASNIAVAGYFQGAWFVEEANTTSSINYRELYALVLAAATWGHVWTSKRLIFYCDNMAVVHILSTGVSRCKPMVGLVRSLLFIAASNNFEYRVEHIPSKSNSVADALSRYDFYRFWHLTPDADVYMTHPKPIPSGFNSRRHDSSGHTCINCV